MKEDIKELITKYKAEIKEIEFRNEKETLPTYNIINDTATKCLNRSISDLYIVLKNSENEIG